VSLAEEYHRQLAWRAWPAVLDALPALAGATVLDVGCGPGDVAALLTARGARVIGFDGNAELLEVARARAIPGAEFRPADLRGPLPHAGRADGLWCSFVAAYFPDLAPALARWGEALRPGGWIALTEVAGLFGHEPVAERTRALLEAYAADARRAGRYDFDMGERLGAELARAGFEPARAFAVPDQEFAFAGPASAAVLDAWRARFDRMGLLRDFCGAEFEPLRADFLACLTRADHRSTSTVQVRIATR
jgi:SAM-dependent methyltransferase